MAGEVISFLDRFRSAARPRDWTQQEIAELYRVEESLLHAGFALEGERGVTDEGDPWFVFCRADDGEVFIHFARLDGCYLVEGGPFGRAVRGDDFRALIAELVGRHPLGAVTRKDSNVLVHPAALLIALVAACFFHSNQVKAAETAEGHLERLPSGAGRRNLSPLSGGVGASESLHSDFVVLDAMQTVSLATALAVALRTEVDRGSALAEARSDMLAPQAILPASAPLAIAAITASVGSISETNGGAFLREGLAMFAAIQSLSKALHPTPIPQADFALVTHGAPLVQVSVAEAVGVEVHQFAFASQLASFLEREVPVALIHISRSDLPMVQAVALLSSIGVLQLISDDRFERIDHLPEMLANLISRGEQLDLSLPIGTSDNWAVLSGPSDNAASPVSPLGSPLTTIVHRQTDQLDGARSTPNSTSSPGTARTSAADSVSSTDHAGDGPVSGDSGDVDITTSPPPVASSPTTSLPGAVSSANSSIVKDVAPASSSIPQTSTSPTPSSSSSGVVGTSAHLSGHSVALDSALAKFTTDVHAEIIVSGSEIVVIDPHILLALSSVQMDSVTFHFDDGSSISLIGTVSALHGFHGLT